MRVHLNGWLCACVVSACLSGSLQARTPREKPRAPDTPAAPGPSVPQCGRVRVFMASDGLQSAAPTSGPTAVNMAPGSTRTVMVWIEDTTGQSTPLDGYQMVMHWSATPDKNATGTVSYVDNNPGLGFGDSVLLDMSRDDWVLSDQPVDLFPAFYNETAPGGPLPPAFGLIFAPAAGLPTSLDGRGVLYLCEFVLEASADASGHFTLTFSQEGPPPPPLSQVFQPQGEEYIIDEYQPLTIVIGDGPLASFPANGSIDARQTSQPDGSDAVAIETVQILYADQAPVGAPEDFEIAVSGGDTPTIVDVQTLVNIQTLTLDPPLSAGECMTVTHLDSGFETRIAHLPADVDRDGTSGPLDILALIDGLNCVSDPPLQAGQCDIDRSGVCLPADILREIDLLNGAGVFDVWNGRTLPACP